MQVAPLVHGDSCPYVSIVAAATARLPGVLPLGPVWFYGLAFIFLLIAVAYDLGFRHRVHIAYILGGGMLVASVPLRLMFSGTGMWRAIAQFLVGRVG